MMQQLRITLRDGWTWWRAVGWPLVGMVLLVWGTVAVLNQQLATGFASAPLRLAVFSEAPAPALFDWLRSRPEVDLRTDVEPMRFRQLVAADSLDAAWIVEEGFAQALTDGQTGSLQQYSDPQRARTEARLDRLLTKYRNYLLEVRMQQTGLDKNLIYPLEVRPVSAGGGLTAVAGGVRRSARWLSLLFGLAVSFYVYLYLDRTQPLRSRALAASAWGVLAVLCTFLGLLLGTTLTGVGALVFENVLAPLWQPGHLSLWLLLAAVVLLVATGLLGFLVRRVPDYRHARGWARVLLVLLLALAGWGLALAPGALLLAT